MSANSISLGLWDSQQYQSFKIDDIDLESTVEILRTEASRKLNTPAVKIDLIYCGLILQDTQSLTSYGIKAGSTVHILRKNPPETPTRKRGWNEPEIQKVVTAFRTFSLTPGFRPALQRVSRPEVLETIIASTPGLSQDPVAIAIIQDPDLILLMSDSDTVRRIAEKHPLLIEAVNYIIVHIREEQANADPNQAGTSTGYSYSLDALSDDEDMESANPLARNSSFNAITAAQLAAAIANATNTSFNANSAGISPQTPNSNNVITSEMFSNAIEAAMGNVRQEEETMESIRQRLQPQLQQMHEMGLTNDGINIRALQATSGDVNAAIELVFNGTID